MAYGGGGGIILPLPLGVFWPILAEHQKTNASKPKPLPLISVGLIPRPSECRAVPMRTCMGPQVGICGFPGTTNVGAAGALIGKGGGAQIVGQVTFMPVCAMVHLRIAVLCVLEQQSLTTLHGHAARARGNARSLLCTPCARNKRASRDGHLFGLLLGSR